MKTVDMSCAIRRRANKWYSCPCPRLLTLCLDLVTQGVSRLVGLGPEDSRCDFCIEGGLAWA